MLLKARLMSGLGTVVVAVGLLTGSAVAARADPPAPAAAPVPAATVTAPAVPAVPATLPVPAASPAPATPPTPCSDLPAVGTAACFDVSAKKVWLVRDGQVVTSAGGLGGKKGYATPTGTFEVAYRDIDHVSSLYDSAEMPYSVFFNDGIAFHQGSLSSRSHGCVHLGKSTARTFYGSLRVGDTVQVVD